jgi:SAM-dependent methyltransferase
LNLETQTSDTPTQTCDLCGSARSIHILRTPRLDGPLKRCCNCNLIFVDRDLGSISAAGDPKTGRNGESSRVASEMVRLAGRARELALVDSGVERNERPWRELAARERLDDLKRFVAGGRLVEVGSSTGELLAAAGSSFTATGVEADEANCRIARSRGLDCFNATLRDAAFPGRHFDAAAMYHVIEHFSSPRSELIELHRVVKPGGWLAIETPNIATFWFRLLGARWRQIIPDHIFFFTPETITRLCDESGFEVRELRSAGKAMSVRLFISRLGRYHRPAAELLEAVSSRLNLSDRTLRLNLGDVMRLYARRR